MPEQVSSALNSREGQGKVGKEESNGIEEQGGAGVGGPGPRRGLTSVALS